MPSPAHPHPGGARAAARAPRAPQETVSVVIPTRGRPALLRRAVRSALAQSRPALEVVVVVDGDDPETDRALDELADPRLRVVRLPAARGGAGARNAGVGAAAGDWIAFLDDDDEWLPHKLEAQLRAAAASAHAYPVLCSRLIARSPRGDYLWPRRVPRPGEPASEYLFARSSLFQGEGIIQTTMLVAPRALLLRVPFTEGLPRHQEWDWVLRAAGQPGVGIEFVPEALAIWYIEEDRPGVSRAGGWTASLDWMERSRALVTPRAYAAFLMTSVSARAAREGAWRACFDLLARAVRFGRPRPIDFLIFLGIWLVPQRARWRLRAALGGAGRV